MGFGTLIQAAAVAALPYGSGPESLACFEDTGKIEVRIANCAALLDAVSNLAGLPDTDVILAEIFARRGYLHLEERNFAEAIADATSAMSHAPELHNALFLRAVAKSNAGQFEAALIDFNALVDKIPSDPLVYVERGIVHRRLGNFETALVDYGKAIELAPDDGNAYHVRAWAFYVRGRLEEALADSNKAVELSGASPEVRSARAHILHALGRKREALSEFLDLARNGPSYLIRRYQQILIMRGYDDIEETGVSSSQLLSGIEHCLRENCQFVFDVELDRPEERAPSATGQ